MTNKPARFFLLTLLMLLAPVAMADNPRSVTVRASGYVEAIPDTLHLQLTVKKTAENLDIARQSVDKTVSKVLDISRTLGIKADDIDSARISTYPEYEWRNDKRHYLGETVVRDISITLHNLDNYGHLITQLSKLPLGQIRRPSLSHSNIEELRLAALKDAIAKGRRKAQVIAEELAVKLGRVLSVQDGDASRSPPQPFRAQATLFKQADSDGGGFSYARQRITASAQIQFELDDQVTGVETNVEAQIDRATKGIADLSKNVPSYLWAFNFDVAQTVANALKVKPVHDGPTAIKDLQVGTDFIMPVLGEIISGNDSFGKAESYVLKDDSWWGLDKSDKYDKDDYEKPKLEYDAKGVNKFFTGALKVYNRLLDGEKVSPEELSKYKNLPNFLDEYGSFVNKIPKRPVKKTNEHEKRQKEIDKIMKETFNL